MAASLALLFMLSITQEGYGSLNQTLLIPLEQSFQWDLLLGNRGNFYKGY